MRAEQTQDLGPGESVSLFLVSVSWDIRGRVLQGCRPANKCRSSHLQEAGQDKEQEAIWDL